MADGVLLLVDANEGPRPQTRFVSRKALERGLRPIVVVNKMDKMTARPDAVLDEVFQLFENLGASESQLDFPIIFASGSNGWASKVPAKSGTNMDPLLDAILEHIPAPKNDPEGPFQFQVISLDYNNYAGGIAIGKIVRGSVSKDQEISVLRASAAPGAPPEKGKVKSLMTFHMMERVEQKMAMAGDIVALSGVDSPRISDTWCAVGAEERLPVLKVDEPTLSATFEVNTSPLAGKEGTSVTSRQLRDRLMKETLTNVALKVEETSGSTSGGAFKVSGRGEMHLGILVETMRREGFELSIGRPSVVRKVENGVKMEPFETLFLDVDPQHQSWVMEQMGIRGGEMLDMEHGTDRVLMEFLISTRALLGFRTEFMQTTAGTGIMYTAFHSYKPQHGKDYELRKNGVMISNGAGTATAYAIEKLQSRGRMFVIPGEQLYEGMVVGIHVAGDNDLNVNVSKQKQLTNIRTTAADEAIILHTPLRMTLERAMEFIADDELVEVTPKNIRIRKKILAEAQRKNKPKAKD